MTTAPGDPEYDDDLEKNWLPKFLRRDPNVKPVKSEVPVMRLPVKVFAPDVAIEAEAPKAKRAPAKVKANGTAAPKAKAKVKAKAVKAAPKAKGKAKPRNVDPDKLDAFGFRLTSIKSKAAAMYARKSGATLGEVKDELESTQFNVLTELKEKGYTVDTKQEDGDGPRKVTRYFVKAKK